MYEFHLDIPLEESEIFKISGGHILSGSQDRVVDHSKGEVDHLYLVWFYDQPPFKAMPNREGAINYIAKTEFKIKKARLEVRGVIGPLLMA